MRISPLLAAASLAIAFASSGCAHPVPAPAPVIVIAPPPTAAAFEPEIEAFEDADRAHPPAPGGIVFVGSSSIRFWSDVAAAFPGEPVLNRGFGGSTLPDVTWFAPRIVLPYKPRLIVLYAGDNDIAAGHTPQQVLADFLEFQRTIRRSLPSTRILFVSIKPSPSRWALAAQMRTANALIAQAVAHDPLDTFVDVFTSMLGSNGRPRPELFRSDSLHMTAAGYAIWRERLAPFIH